MPFPSLCSECSEGRKKCKLKAIDNTQAVSSSAEYRAAQLLDLWYHGKALGVDLLDFSAFPKVWLRCK